MIVTEECPKCLTSTKVMEPNDTVGFTYKTCSLCNGKGVVLPTIAEDYINSQKPFDDDTTDVFYYDD